MTYDDLRKAAYALYEQKAYAEALALVNREAPNFPASAYGIQNWRMCLACLLGDTDLAMAVFRSAVADGLWYSPHMLRTDPDLAAIQGLPEFERLVAVCAERSAAAQAAAVPFRLTFGPQAATGSAIGPAMASATGPAMASATGPATGPAPLMIAMHGNGENAGAAEEHWRPLTAQGWMVALPQSSQIQAPDSYIWDDRDWAVAEVERHAGELLRDPGVDVGRVVLGGFSMGGGIAVWMALAAGVGVRGVGARGFVAVGPWLPDVGELRPFLAAGVPEGLRGYIVVGDRDKESHAVSIAVRDLLAEFGVPCELEVHEGMGHTYPAEFDRSLERATRFILHPSS